MNFKFKSALVIGILILSVSITFWSFTPEKNQVSGATLYVNSSGQYTTIQSAIDAADEFDTIIVENNTYNEDLIINKTGLILKGNSSKDTVIDGSIEVLNGSVQILNCNITANSKHGIFINSVIKYTVIKFEIIDCSIHLTSTLSNKHGIFVYQSLFFPAGDPQVRFKSFSGAIHGTSHNSDFYRLMNML